MHAHVPAALPAFLKLELHTDQLSFLSGAPSHLRLLCPFHPSASSAMQFLVGVPPGLAPRPPRRLMSIDLLQT